jgi:hypothetical protein
VFPVGTAPLLRSVSLAPPRLPRAREREMPLDDDNEKHLMPPFLIRAGLAAVEAERVARWQRECAPRR